jgi:hypothetical protein
MIRQFATRAANMLTNFMRR